MDRSIVMDNVSGLADKFNDFASFLTVFWKFKYSCIYIFHIIYPEKSIWKLILSQTKIFNIFPSSLEKSSVMKIIPANSQQTHSSWWRHLENVFRLRLQKTSWRRLDQHEYVRPSLTSSEGRLQDVLVKTNIFVLSVRLQDVFKRFWRRLQDVFKTFWRRLQDVLQKRLQGICKTSSRRFEEVFKTSSSHFQDVVKTVWRCLQDALQSYFKTFSRRIIKLNCSC